MLLNNIGDLIVYLGLIAVAAERITASVKSLGSLQTTIKDDKLRAFAVQGVAFATSLIAAILNPPTDIMILQNLPLTTSIPLVALLSSAGSNVWHDALSMFTAVKEKHQALAEIAKSDTPK